MKTDDIEKLIEELQSDLNSYMMDLGHPDTPISLENQIRNLITFCKNRISDLTIALELAKDKERAREVLIEAKSLIERSLIILKVDPTDFSEYDKIVKILNDFEP